MLELARAEEWEAVRALSVQVHDLHVAWRPDIFCASQAPYPYELYIEDIQKRMVYVAKISEQIVGYVTFSIAVKNAPGLHPKRQLCLNTICVDSLFRRQGIGRTMIQDVRALAKAFRCHELILGVHPENDDAVGFYQKCGFCIRSIHMDMNA